jgi:predicted nucleic acid-binding protein
LSLFVDSSVWYAAADRADRSHARAKAILSKAERGVTTDHVLVETWLLHHHHRLGKHAAERFWGGLKSGVAAIESVTAADLEVAWAIGDSFLPIRISRSSIGRASR